MSNNRIVWDGLEELKRALRRMPEELRGAAAEIVREAVVAAEEEIRAAYPVGSFGRHRTIKRSGRRKLIDPGNLKRGLKVEEQVSRFGVGYILRNTAPHAWIFEQGTAARHYLTRRGRTKVVGAMPPGRVFVPRVIKHRRRMHARLRQLVRSRGFEVAEVPDA